MFRSFFIACLAVLPVVPSVANPLAVFNLTRTGKSYEYFTPENAGTTPIYRGVNTTDSAIIVRDLNGYRDSSVVLTIVGSKKYFHVDLVHSGKWNSAEVGVSANLRRGEIRYPTGNYYIEYAVDGDTLGDPFSDYYSRESSYLFGVKRSVAIPGANTETFADNSAGYGSLFRVRVQKSASADYPSAGTVVTARNFLGSVKYNSKNTALINTGKSIEVAGETLQVGTRGYALYQLTAGLKKLGYVSQD